MRRLGVADLVWLNTVVVRQAGGAVGVRDKGALEGAVARPFTAYGGKELFPTPFAKAAALMQTVIQLHPFVDGNKRTGLLAGATLLHLAVYDLAAPRREMVEASADPAPSVWVARRSAPENHRAERQLAKLPGRSAQKSGRLPETVVPQNGPPRPCAKTTIYANTLLFSSVRCYK